jgi:hypothetical protein
MLVLVSILELLMLSHADDFLSLIVFGLDKESQFPIPFYCILFSTQLRPVSIVADIVE